MRLLIINIWIIAFMSACHSQSSTPKQKNYHEVVVQEVQQASQYTYLKLKENNEEHWVALPKTQAEVGKTYYYKGGYLMTDFASKDLNKTFEKVYFIESISDKPITEDTKSSSTIMPHNAVPENNSAPIATHKAIVKEVLQANKYTYLFVEENGTEQWLALPKIEAKVGNTYYYAEGMLMNEFESKDLNRTFKEVYFITGVSSEPLAGEATTVQDQQQTTKPVIEKKAIAITPDKGGITIKELYSNLKSYAGKSVIIKGEITKYNAKIMGKNWVHIQDGTSHGDSFDLTATTNAEVTIGDVVTLKGIITLDKDFGYGYFYEVIMEEATIIK